MSRLVLDPNSRDHWDEEVDVLVLGLGCAGAAAALEAAAAGADTLVVEKAGGGGGTSAMSGGVLYLGGGTAMQRDCGFEDDEQSMYEYLMASVGDAPDEQKIRVYCEGSVAHYDWLVAQGVPFKHTFYDGCSGEPPTDDGLVWSGSEQIHPFCDIAKPAPRGHVPQIEHQGGPQLMRSLCAAVDASPARVQADTTANALYQAADGEIIGARLEHFGETRHVRARGGVVLTTGGFVLDDEMLRQHAPAALRCNVRIAAQGDDGSGIRLGQAAGADTQHMDKVSVSLPATQPWGFKRGLLVNAQGQRFIPEDAYMGRLGEWALLHHGGHAWLIVDDEIHEQPEYPRKLVAVADSIEELGAELGLPPGSLEATVGVYNRHAASGADPVFQKRSKYLKPLDQAPFGAFDCNVESSIYAVFTLGGLRSDVDGCILDPTGSPIPGLYGAGRTTSGLSVGSYSSGLSLGDGTFFGRAAGRSAAAHR